MKTTRAVSAARCHSLLLRLTSCPRLGLAVARFAAGAYALVERRFQADRLVVFFNRSLKASPAIS